MQGSHHHGTPTHPGQTAFERSCDCPQVHWDADPTELSVPRSEIAGLTSGFDVVVDPLWIPEHRVSLGKVHSHGPPESIGRVPLWLLHVSLTC